MVLDMERWIGKVAMVTGASSGIGKAIAEVLVGKGLQVVALARREDRLFELSEKLKNKKGQLHPIKADVTVEEDVLNAFKWTEENLGHVHILINNAGILRKGYLSESDTEVFKSVLDTNVLGLCVATREALKIMRANQIDGNIIHINSIAGHSVSQFPGVNVYFASKFAVTALTETLRHELNQLGTKIRVTSISPGVVDTEIFGLIDSSGFLEQMKQENRSLYSEDIADAVVYVLSAPPHVQIHEIIIKPVGEIY